MARVRNSKSKEIIKLTEDILKDLETEDVSLVSILPKCKKLARLRNDFEALNWFSLELNGYDNKSLPENLKGKDWSRYAEMAGRDVTEEDKLKPGNKITNYYIWSISEIESQLESQEEQSKMLQLPSTFHPTVTHYKAPTGGFMGGNEVETVHETFGNVIDKIAREKDSLSNVIRENKGILTRIRNRVHDYVLKVYYEVKFEDVTDDIFQKMKTEVEKKLTKVCPEAIREFVGAFDRLKSSNAIELSQAMSSCRRVLKEFADSVYPPSDSPYIDSGGNSRLVTDTHVRNRIWAYLDKKHSGSTKGKLLKVKIEDLGARVDSLYDLASKGMKTEIDRFEVEMCVIEIFLLLGYILSF